MRLCKANQRRACSVLFLLLLVHVIPVQAQVAGCKDPTASNYNASATVNDGSCTYSTTAYTPPVRVDPISNALAEGSGLQMAGNFLWSFNDGGGAAAIYRIDTLTNAILQTVNLEGATNVDWEDIAFDGTSFYIGDFGNNTSGDRTDLKIYKFPLSAVPDYTANATVTIPSGKIDVLRFTYSDQVPVAASAPNNTRFDCEAMLVDEGKIHLFTKNWVEVSTTHYAINGTSAGTYVAAPVETLSTGYLVTAADKAPGTSAVVLIGYQASGTGNHFMHLLSDFSGGLYFNGNKRLINLPTAAEMGQVEGITFRNSSYGYISNEYFTRTVLGFTLTVAQKLRSFDLNSFLPVYVLQLQVKNFAAVKRGVSNQLNWEFAVPVKDLKVQHSTNRVDFTTLQTYPTSAGGTFSHQPTGAVNCYRLSWKDANGGEHFSEIICLNNEAKTALSNIVLRNSGELSFVLNGNESSAYTFRLMTTDGKLVAQTAQQVVVPGSNRIRFLKTPSRHAVVLLQAIGSRDQSNLLLRVE